MRNVAPYQGDDKFLVGPSARTKAVWDKLQPYFQEERKKGVLDVDAAHPSTVLAHGPGYIDRDNELIVGLQTDKPFKRAIFPFGGLRMVEAGLKAAGFEPDKTVHEIFTHYRKSHNDGVFDVYTPEIMRCRRSHVITGLPDAYGRGRIIGDYRRVALYGVDRLLAVKRAERAQLDDMWASEDVIRLREELAEQMRALRDLAAMAKRYDCDITRAAETAREAVQWTYLAYLGAIKEANGAAMSIGRISTFLDAYIERDVREGTLDESGAQELIDQLVQKLRIVRFLRTPEYDALFSGDPYWATECIGGMDLDGRPLVTRTSYRMLHTLSNLGPAPEPNLTVLWSHNLPAAFKRYCIRISRDTSSIQYENDDLMRPYWGDDYGIACCVSSMRLGKQMQFFGARVNLAKVLLYAINGGRDELSGDQVAPVTAPVTSDVLDYDEVFAKFDATMEWLARTYVHALNCIHYMHDKYFYERLEIALHDRDILRTMACGIAGLSVAADSLSASSTRRSTSSATTGASPSITASRATFQCTATQIYASTKSPLNWCRGSWQRYASIRPTEMRPTRSRSSPSRPTWCTARIPAPRRTGASRASRSRPGPIRCMVAIPTAGWPPAFRSRGCRTPTRRTASAIPSPLRQALRSATAKRASTTRSRPSTPTSARAGSI